VRFCKKLILLCLEDRNGAQFWSIAVVLCSTLTSNLFQARGPKKHLKRLNAPKAWMLDKLGGVFAPRPSTGPHKLRESLPLVIFLRNRLKYALTNSEVTKIVMQRLIKVDGKVRTDPNYPAGFMGRGVQYFFTFLLH
jgi:hypothetical protein